MFGVLPDARAVQFALPPSRPNQDGPAATVTLLSRRTTNYEELHNGNNDTAAAGGEVVVAAGACAFDAVRSILYFIDREDVAKVKLHGVDVTTGTSTAADYLPFTAEAPSVFEAGYDYYLDGFGAFPGQQHHAIITGPDEIEFINGYAVVPHAGWYVRLYNVPTCHATRRFGRTLHCWRGLPPHCCPPPP